MDMDKAKELVKDQANRHKSLSLYYDYLGEKVRAKGNAEVAEALETVLEAVK